jgi:hypothetical protein
MDTCRLNRVIGAPALTEVVLRPVQSVYQDQVWFVFVLEYGDEAIFGRPAPEGPKHPFVGFRDSRPAEIASKFTQ